MTNNTKRALRYFILENSFIVLTIAIVWFMKSNGGFASGMFGFPTGALAIVVYLLNLVFLLKSILRSSKNKLSGTSLYLCIATAIIPIIVVAGYYILNPSY